MSCSKHSLRDRCSRRAEIVGDAPALHVLAPGFRVKGSGCGFRGFRVHARGLGFRGFRV